ncbi:MAG: Crp/Fnr family transcriptional regulator [Betaproteobacteria bacterium]
MEELDFTGGTARDEIYDPAIAQTCFKALGSPESVEEGKFFFEHNQTSERMYLLLEGQVRLIRGTKTLDIIRPGEIFGELAVLAGHPRTASAVATSACRALSLDANHFEKAIQTTPEFALMLMGILINRLRLSVAILERTGNLPDRSAKDASNVFDKAMLGELTAALKQRPPLPFPARRTIMKEGEKGGFMYVVVKGNVAVSIKSNVVERAGPGGVFGEMALFDQSPRAASAVAETDAELLPVYRDDFISLVKTKPAFAVSLLRSLAERLRRMTARQA